MAYTSQYIQHVKIVIMTHLACSAGGPMYISRSKRSLKAGSMASSRFEVHKTSTLGRRLRASRAVNTEFTALYMK